MAGAPPSGARQATVTVDRFATPADWRDDCTANDWPTIAVLRGLAEQPDRAAVLDAELVELAARFDRGTGSSVLDWQSLLLTARRR